MFNADFAKQDKKFQDACERGNVKPTTRQAAKYRRGDGTAYKFRNDPKENKVEVVNGQ